MGRPEENDDYQHLAALAGIERKLGVPEGFTRSLAQDGTDWEFAVKLMVLLEGALTKVIAAHLQNEAVAKHVQRLNLNGRSSKVALAQDLNILTKAEAKAMLALSEIRNAFAHRVENISGDLLQFAKAMPEQDRANFVKTGLMVPDEMGDSVKFLWREESFYLHLRLLMWSIGETLLAVLATQDEHAARERRRREWLEQTAKAGAGYFTLADLYKHGPALSADTPLVLKMASQGEAAGATGSSNKEK